MGRNSEKLGSPLVRRAHKGKLFSREARGFSQGELAKAGLDLQQARRLGFKIDERRKTIYDFNIDLLKKQSPSQAIDSSNAELGEAKKPMASTAKNKGKLVETVEAATE